MRRLVAVILGAVLVVSFGCSGGGSALTPDLEQADAVRSAAVNSTVLWGIWDVTFDPDSNAAEIVPIRHADFTANVTQFLQPPISKTHLMKIDIDPSTDFSTGYVVVDVIFTHPFPGLDSYTGFDVRGVCIGNGSVAGIADPNIMYAGGDDVRVLNPDGLTRWFNPSEFTTYEKLFGFTMGRLGTPSYDFTATLNGYKYYCNDLESEDDLAGFLADPACTNPRGFFSAGNTLRREYEIQFPVVGGAPELRFQYAVIASWEPPDPDPPMSIPDDFSLSANCQEAFCLSAADQSDMYYVDPSTKGGTLRLMVRVFDHQGAGSPSGVAPEIAAIHLETPDGLITTGGLASFDPTALAGALTAEDEKSVTYLLEVADVDPPGTGEFPVLVSVENADPDDYDSGFPGFAYPDGALAAYLIAEVGVGSTTPPTVLAIDPDSGDIDTLLEDVEVTGLNFIDGAEVTLIKNDDPGVVIEATSEVVSGGTLITCDLDLDSAAGAELGVYDVRVTNPGGASGQLDDGFEVTESAWPYWWECIMYNPAHVGRNPMASTANPDDLTQLYSVSASGTYKYCTPVVADDKVFFIGNSSFYSNTNTRVYCHDLTTGALLWNARINPSGVSQRCHPGYAFYDAGGGDERLVVGGDQVYCFDANSSGSDPAPLWTYDDTDPSNQNWLGTQLTVYEDKVLAKGRVSAALYILDVSDGSLIHEVPIMAAFESGVAGANGKAYAVGYNYGPRESYLDCIDIASGTIDWTWHSGYSYYGVDHWNGPLVEDGRVYFGSYNGVVFCIAAEAQGSHLAGDEIWRFTVPSGNPLNGGVAKLGNHLFCGCAFSSPVYCISDDGDSASLAWSSPVTGYFDAHMTVAITPGYPDGVVIAPTVNQQCIYFLDATDGTLIRNIGTGEQMRGGASMAGDYVVVAGQYNLRVYQ